MALTLRESDIIAAAKKRMAGLKAIDPTGQLDLGNGHSVKSYQDVIDSTDKALEDYNESLKVADGLKNKLEAAEKTLNKKSSNMLTAVGQRYTKDSSEYEQAGGVRESERKKPGRKPSKPAADAGA